MSPDPRISLGVAPLSALDVPVLDYVQAAADAGFQFVGLRAQAVADTDPDFPLDMSTTAFRNLQAAVVASGMDVLDLEVFTIEPGIEREDWLPVLAVGERLGARYLNVIGAHPSIQIFEQAVGQLTEDARNVGMVPVLEPVAYRHLNDFGAAIRIARAVDCAVELDVLHFLRTGASLDTISAHRDLFPILQLCDAPATLDGHGEVLAEVAASRGDHDLAIAESRGLRLLPGDGAGPISELMEILGTSTHVSVEVPNVSLRGDLQATDYLRLLRERSQAYLSAHRRDR